MKITIKGDRPRREARATLIDDCEFAVKCPKRWQKLQRTEQPDVRHCNQCERSVHLCNTPGELAAAQKMGLCVAIPVTMSDLIINARRRGHTVGLLSPNFFDEAGAGGDEQDQ